MSEAAPKVSAADLALRISPKPVTRLNKKVIYVTAFIVIVTLFIVVYYGLFQSVNLGQASEDAKTLYANEHKKNVPADIDKLAKDYSSSGEKRDPLAKGTDQPNKDAPRLGPPLPGDLGKPMLNAGAGGANAPAGDIKPPAVAAQISQEEKDRQHREQERQKRLDEEAEAALKSPLFPRSANGGGGIGDAMAGAVDAATGSGGAGGALLSTVMDKKAQAALTAERLKAMARSQTPQASQTSQTGAPPPTASQP